MADTDPKPQSSAPGSPQGTGIQAGAKSGSTKIQPAPTPKPRLSAKRKPQRRMTVEEAKSWMFGLDIVIVVALLAFTFLAASFAVRNSDFWLHLGTGKLIAQGNYAFGVDPFSYSTEGVYWANHAWLFDLVLYKLYTGMGESSVVLVKAGLMVLMVLVLLGIRQPGQRTWWSAFMLGLAVLPMSTRFLLQPAIASYFLLATTLYLLLAPVTVAENGESVPFLRSPRRWWLLPGVFVLWVNLDAWFILGPICVGLFLLGKIARNFVLSKKDEDTAHPTVIRTLLLVTVVGIVACLINPHHIHAFRLPNELSWTVRESLNELKADKVYRTYYHSPLQAAYYESSPGNSFAGYCYIPLAIVTMLSMVLMYSRVRLDLMLLYVVFLALGAYTARCIPFFAIVAAPIAAYNYHTFFKNLWDEVVTFNFKGWLLTGRFVLMLLFVALGFLSWPGLLWSDWDDPYHARRVTWTVEPDDSMTRAARQLHDWHAEGKIPEGTRGFTASPEFAHYLAWHCPEEKYFFDFRFQLYDRNTFKEFNELREAMNPEINVRDIEAAEGREGDAFKTPERLRSFFRAHGINRIVRVDRSAQLPPFQVERLWELRMNPQISRIGYANLALDYLPVPTIWKIFWSSLNRDEWPMIYLHGKTLMCAWNDRLKQNKGEASDRWWSNLQPDFRKQAFGPEESIVKAPATSPEWPDPSQPIIPGDELKHYWGKFADRPSPRTPYAEQAKSVLLYGYALERDHIRRETEIGTRNSSACFEVGFVGQAAGLANLGGLGRIAYVPQIWMMAGVRQAVEPGVMKSDAYNLTMMVLARSNYIFQNGDLPVHIPYLALRCARLGIAENPNDSDAYKALANASSILQRKSGDARQVAALPLMSQARQAQRMAALQQALLLEPDDWATHYTIGVELRDHYPDSALIHLKAALEGFRRNRTVKTFDKDAYQDQLSSLEKQVDTLEKQVDRNVAKFEKDSKGELDVPKAKRAVETFGLAEKALEILQGMDRSVDAADDPIKIEKVMRGVNLEIQLLLDLGRIHHPNLTYSLSKDGFQNNKYFAYTNYAFRRAIAFGNYKEADELLEKMLGDEEERLFNEQLHTLGQLAVLRPRNMSEMKFSPLYLLEGLPESFSGNLEATMSLAITRALLSTSPYPMPYYHQLREFRNVLSLYGMDVIVQQGRSARIETLFGPIRKLSAIIALRGDIAAMRGLVALEEGDMPRARKYFEQTIAVLYTPEDRGAALSAWKSPAIDCAGREPAVYWLRELDKKEAVKK